MKKALTRVLYEVCLQSSPENDCTDDEEEEPYNENLYSEIEAKLTIDDGNENQDEAEIVKSQLFNNCLNSQDNTEKNEFDFFEEGIQNQNQSDQ